MKRAVVFIGLALIVLANILMMYYAPYGLVRRMEGYQDNSAPANSVAANSTATNMNAVAANAASTNAAPSANSVTNVNAGQMTAAPVEGFSSYSIATPAGAKDVYQPMGQYDGVKLSTGNSVSGWRYTAPNEPLTGDEFVPGDDELFMFKNNQCKPECCGASFSCGGGCVCTTPKQRQYIAERGGNRTQPEDSA
jgi:hypothetical protein